MGSLLIERELFYVLLIFVPLKKNEKIEKKRKNICDKINLPKKRNKKREKNKNKIK